MQFQLTIHNLDNAAFGDNVIERGEEIGRLLRYAADRVRLGVIHGKLRDINGNTVGEFTIGLSEKTLGE